MLQRPKLRPITPFFSSGPCAKRPGWSLNDLKANLCGRSHHSPDGRARIHQALAQTRELLQLPADYFVAMVPGSDTGAMEMAMWSLLGVRGIDVLVFDEFGRRWEHDITEQLKITDTRIMRSGYGSLPDLAATSPDRDIVFVWNATSSGVCLPDGDWIADDRSGLTICDATSAIFANRLPFDKLDVTTFSWQKTLGGEGAHGMIILSPRAIERLESYRPNWPIPRIFHLTDNGKLKMALFSDGSTINTPSMLCVEDYLACLEWAKKIGGLTALIARTSQNAKALASWVEKSPWLDFLTPLAEIRSNTSACLKLTGEFIKDSDKTNQVIPAIILSLGEERVAYDIASHPSAPPGLRIWTGPTIETSDLQLLFPWLDWAFTSFLAQTNQNP